MTNAEIAGFFNATRPHIQGNPNLCDPHVEGWFRARLIYDVVTGKEDVREAAKKPA